MKCRGERGESQSGELRMGVREVEGLERKGGGEGGKGQDLE